MQQHARGQHRTGQHGHHPRLPTSVTSFANSDVAVAQAEATSAEELDVNVKNLASGVPVVQGVVGGSLDIGATSFEPVVNADAQGGDLVIIGSYANQLTVSMVTPDSVHRPAQLRGNGSASRRSARSGK